MRRLVFVDFEASALRDGYPIEVGWAWAENAHVEARSMLIARADEWQSPGYQWDPMAEAIHGLTLEQVDRQGQPVIEFRPTFEQDQLSNKWRSLFTALPTVPIR